MCVRFLCADAVTDGRGGGRRAEPGSRLPLAVCLERGEMNQPLTSISADNQIEHTSDNFSTDGQRTTALKMAQTALGPAKHLPSFLSAR